MPRSRRQQPRSASQHLRVVLGEKGKRRTRPFAHDYESWTVVDDWPQDIPVTPEEVDLFEAYFGDVFDELFGPCR